MNWLKGFKWKIQRYVDAFCVDENNNAVNKANVGMLGIINGFIGEGVICACYDDNWTLTRFELLKNIEETRFELKNIEGSTND